MQLEAYAHTDTGPVREHNEDSMLIDLEAGVFVVADGMGGHAAGEVASALAVEAVHATLVGARDPDETRLVREHETDDPADILRERLRYAMNQASIRIRRESELRAETKGMGTTLVVLVIDGDQAHLAHVGDSRAYLFRDGRLVRLTRDHTVVQQEVDMGHVTPEMARHAAYKHILTQSVGYHGPVEPDTTTRWVEPGDVFVLCSDGMTDPMDDEVIRKIIADTPIDLLANVLVDEAIKNGTEDNVTVVVVGVREDD